MSSSQLRAFVSLGSNIEPERNLPAAVELLAGRLEVVGASRVYRTQAVGSPSMPGFLNAAVEIATALRPRALKYGVLRAVEAELGRVRSFDRNAPRTIDLDIALYGECGEWVVSEPGVELPDPEILSRAHVARPLADLAPDLVHPVDGRALGRLAAGLEGPGVRLDDKADRLREVLDAL